MRYELSNGASSSRCSRTSHAAFPRWTTDALLPLLNSGAVALIENDRLDLQLTMLERHTARGGKDSIDHPRGAHDDLANAAAGALVNAFKEQPGFQSDLTPHIGFQSEMSQDEWLGA